MRIPERRIDRTTIDAMNVHDDPFDLAEACLSVGIALAGVTALTRKRWLFKAR